MRISTEPEFLKKSPFRIDVEFRNKLTQPYLLREQRKDQIESLEKSLQQFYSQFEKITPGNYPPIIDTDDINFKIFLTESEKGYPGVFLSSYSVELDYANDYLTFRLSEKAEKREKFPSEFKNYSYIISFVSDEDSIDSMMLGYLLYGSTMHLGLGFNHKPEYQKLIEEKRENDWKELLETYHEKCPYWEDILEAAKKGCLYLLLKNYLIPHDYCYVSKPGIYLANKSMKNISGILFFQRRNKDFFFQNPFCESEIFDRIFLTF